jgi:hypothetical protein
MTVEKVPPPKTPKTAKPEKYYFEYGSVTGNLETIEIHNGKNICYIYLYNNKRVKCKFPPELYEDIYKAFGRRVEIHGRLTSVESRPFPVLVEATEITVFPPEDTLPSILEMKGIANGALGDQTIEEYIWEIRNEWQ